MMGIKWSAIADFIARLSVLALQWYREVNSNPDQNDEYRARKAAARVIDPDTPETRADQVEVD